MMLVVALTCLLVLATTVLHYEVLRSLNVVLPRLGIPNRLKLVVVILAAFVAHAAEMALYGTTFYSLVAWLDVGNLNAAGSARVSLLTTMYFSAETYTSLGFGDITPVGQLRMLAGVEALNGLLLIGWSASFTYICMEKFWRTGPEQWANARELLQVASADSQIQPRCQGAAGPIESLVLVRLPKPIKETVATATKSIIGSIDSPSNKAENPSVRNS